MTTKESYWTEIFHEQETSGLTQKEFCRQKQIKLSTFHYWKSRLKSSENPAATGFIEITDAPDQACPEPEEELPAGKHLEVRWAKGFGFRFHLRWG